jgi:hypothetical protein
MDPKWDQGEDEGGKKKSPKARKNNGSTLKYFLDPKKNLTPLNVEDGEEDGEPIV